MRFPLSPILWRLQIRAGDHLEAADTLMGLAEGERESASRREIWASLAKLAVLEAQLRDDERLARAELLLQLAKHHKRLLGLAPDQMDWGVDDAAPLTGKQLIRAHLDKGAAPRVDDFTLSLDICRCLAKCRQQVCSAFPPLWGKVDGAGPGQSKEWERLRDEVWAACLGSEGWESWTSILEGGEPRAALHTNFAHTLSALIGFSEWPPLQNRLCRTEAEG